MATRDSSLLRNIGRMAEAIRHRGPDDEGYLLANSRSGAVSLGRGRDTNPEAEGADLAAIDTAPFDVAFGHRRLAILDLSVGGHQPMSSRDGSLWITYNGEIYNYIELRAELEGAGASFATASDTEVLLAAWEAWGVEALHRLNGMWGFALLDLRTRRLVLSRDRFGEKPLYYRHEAGAFVFSSELGALNACSPSRVDEKVLASFLKEGVVEEGERTFFEGISRVPPGGVVVLDIEKGNVSVNRWYALPTPNGPAPSIEEFRSLLDDAVRLRRRSDVPVGTCLSGGLDSSAIAALSARQIGATGDYHAFSALFADAGFSEERFVKDAVAATGVIDHVITPDGDSLARDFVEFVRTQGEPTPSLGAYTQFCVARAVAGAQVKVLLDGQGADELLAGYHYQAGPYIAEVWGRQGAIAAFREARLLAANMARSPLWLSALATYHRFSWPPSVASFARSQGATHAVLPGRALAQGFASLAEPGLKHHPAPVLDGERRRSLTVTSLPALLRYEDRNTMHFAVEARLPFLDPRLVEAGLRLSGSALFRGGWTKSILRDAAADLLPASIIRRRDKLGFATPEKRLLGEAAPRVLEILTDGGDLGGRLERTFVERQIAAHKDLADRPYLARWCTTAIWLKECVRA